MSNRLLLGIVLVSLLLSACGGTSLPFLATATPYPTYTPLPTYTPAPTQTVYPTYTPFPTPTPFDYVASQNEIVEAMGQMPVRDECVLDAPIPFIPIDFPLQPYPDVIVQLAGFDAEGYLCFGNATYVYEVPDQAYIMFQELFVANYIEPSIWNDKYLSQGRALAYESGCYNDGLACFTKWTLLDNNKLVFLIIIDDTIEESQSQADEYLLLYIELMDMFLPLETTES